MTTLSFNDGQLLSPPALALNPERTRWLQQLDQDPTLLLDYLSAACPSRRLGLQYEAFWHFFLQQDPQTDLIAHNIPVRDSKGRSLGEFDVVYKDRLSGTFYHLELAVKFFLALDTPVNKHPLSLWLGPNSADRLDKKLLRLLNHQLPLAASPEGEQSLRTLGVTQTTPQLRIGGMLFHQPNTDISHSDPSLHARHLKGQWLHLEAFQNLHGEWRKLGKPDWLSADFSQGEPLDENLASEVKQRPLMLINAAGERIFLVSQDWPSHPK